MVVGQSELVIDPSYLVGDVITCTATKEDNADALLTTDTTASVVVENTPPEFSLGATVEENGTVVTTAQVGDVLSCAAIVTDVEDGPFISATLEWSNNGLRLLRVRVIRLFPVMSRWGIRSCVSPA